MQLQTLQAAPSKAQKGLLSKLFSPLKVVPKTGGSHHGSSRGTYLAKALLVAAIAQQQDLAQQQNQSGQQHSADTGATHTSVRNGTSALQWSAPDLGYPRDLEAKYELREVLGKGGNGVVRLAVDRSTGNQYAVKSIVKVLGDNASDKKKSTHLESLQREIAVLTKLRGCLNIVELHDVFEDDEHVHIVQECCKGGELWHRIGTRHYSERTVASYMRAVLRTLAVMHSHHILHRDIKPENFMLLNHDDRSPLKAIDFGLAMPFEPEELPRSDLGLEGTPWYMAPEVLSSQVTPASDLWAAGVMAYQLLTGMMPFDDKRNPFNPAVSAIWKSVLLDDIKFDGPAWEGISDDAKNFVKSLLDRNPNKRPTAKDALKHAWLVGDSRERSTGTRLAQSVVQRIQRFAQSSVFKRSVLQAIAAELLQNPEKMGEASETCHVGERGRVIIDLPNSGCIETLYKQMGLDNADEVGADNIAKALHDAGVKLAPTEVGRLLEQFASESEGMVTKSEFAASQLDWKVFQRQHVDLWMDMVSTTFSNLDTNGDGFLSKDEILEALRKKVPEQELRLAMEHAMEEAGLTDRSPSSQAMDLKDFMRMLHVSSMDSLDLYDDRMSLGSLDPRGSVERLNALLQKSSSLASLASALDSTVHSRDNSHYGASWAAHAAGGLNDSVKGAAKASGPDGSVSGNMMFNFDVVSPRAPESAPVPNNFFRFDVAGPDSHKEEPIAQPIAAAAAVPVVERRQHGSSLYKNAFAPGRAGGAKLMPTVRE